MKLNKLDVALTEVYKLSELLPFSSTTASVSALKRINTYLRTTQGPLSFIIYRERYTYRHAEVVTRKISRKCIFKSGKKNGIHVKMNFFFLSSLIYAGNFIYNLSTQVLK